MDKININRTFLNTIKPRNRRDKDAAIDFIFCTPVLYSGSSLDGVFCIFAQTLLVCTNTTCRRKEKNSVRNEWNKKREWCKSRGSKLLLLMRQELPFASYDDIISIIYIRMRDVTTFIMCHLHVQGRILCSGLGFFGLGNSKLFTQNVSFWEKPQNGQFLLSIPLNG